MNTSKILAVICIFSTLFLGCYSSVVVVPDDADNVRTNSGYIDCVVTNDGKKYEFEKAPVVVNDSLIGEATVTQYGQMNREETLIPLSDLALVRKSKTGAIEFAVTKAGAQYTYDEPPVTVDGAVVGKAQFVGFTPMKGYVSIPLSNIQSVEGSQLEVANTIGFAALMSVLAAGVVFALTFHGINVGPVL